MKHITIGEINNFQCVGSECPYTCCAGWNVSVDEKTDQYYQSVPGAFGDELREKIYRKSKPAAMKMAPNGRCPFLNDENLCRIYIELGPEHMCDTCRIYPRLDQMAGDRILHYMTISCPEVGRIFFSRKTPIEFHIMEDGNHRTAFSVNAPDWTFFRIAERAFEVNLEILQNRAHTVAERERAMLLFNRAIQDAIDAERWGEVETLITFFSSPNNYVSLTQSEVHANLSSKVRFIRDLCDVVLLSRKVKSPFFQLFLTSVEYIGSGQADMDAFSDWLREFDQEEFQREQENFLIYLLFRHYLSETLLDSNTNRDLFQRLMVPLSLYQFYRIFTALFSIKEGIMIDMKKRALIASFLSRWFEHAVPKFQEEFRKALEKNQFYDMGFLFQLIS